jgi:hypothetical protein
MKKYFFTISKILEKSILKILIKEPQFANILLLMLTRIRLTLMSFRMRKIIENQKKKNLKGKFFYCL